MSEELKKVLVMLRLALGFVFLWTFLDKTFGLGFSTVVAKSWLSGASPTMGYLANGTDGPFGEMFAGMAGSVVVDWLFMMGMLGVGLALMLGMGMRVAVVSGSLLMGLIYVSQMPPKSNPFVDQHVIYVLVLWLLWFSNAGDYYGLGKWWKKQWWVKKWPVLV